MRVPAPCPPTTAARLPQRDLAALRKEVERIARSVVVTKRIVEGK